MLFTTLSIVGIYLPILCSCGRSYTYGHKHNFIAPGEADLTYAIIQEVERFPKSHIHIIVWLLSISAMFGYIISNLIITNCIIAVCYFAFLAVH